jgi:hypothetical protein
MRTKQRAIPPLVGAIHELPLPVAQTMVNLWIIQSSFLKSAS